MRAAALAAPQRRGAPDLLRRDPPADARARECCPGRARVCGPSEHRPERRRMDDALSFSLLSVRRRGGHAPPPGRPRAARLRGAQVREPFEQVPIVTFEDEHSGGCCSAPVSQDDEPL